MRKRQKFPRSKSKRDFVRKSGSHWMNTLLKGPGARGGVRL